MPELKTCNKNCRECSKLNVRVDDKGYPFGYECMKYEDSILEDELYTTKRFQNNN